MGIFCGDLFGAAYVPGYGAGYGSGATTYGGAYNGYNGYNGYGVSSFPPPLPLTSGSYCTGWPLDSSNCLYMPIRTHMTNVRPQ